MLIEALDVAFAEDENDIITTLAVQMNEFTQTENRGKWGGSRPRRQPN